MNIVNLCCYGEAYYSGSTYEENIAINEEFYEKIKSIFTNDYKIYLGELDGKHSEVMGTIDIQYFDENEIADAGFDKDDNDGDSFYWNLKDRVDELGFDLDEEIKKVKDYINSLDMMVDVMVRVKKSDKSKIINYALSLYMD